MRLAKILGIFAAASFAGVFPTAAQVPEGVFLWFPEQGAMPSSADCDALVQLRKPSREKAEALFWGRAPFGSELEFYLFLDRSRMEPTYAAEGDYDTGSIRFGQTQGDETAFELVPDDHPTVTIKGVITAPSGSSVIKVVLRNIPSHDGMADRVSYFCRFEDGVLT